MKLVILLSIFLVLSVIAAPQSKLEYGNNDSKQVLEEVVVESVLHVKSPSGRQARTNTRTNLHDGARISETKPKLN
ncbi:uncharacterized protein LOC125059901 [Pieris napi]|uniref:uncharacterized protein LOC125059901 n=1 Tax=Pieris napi TaxID=78633 RepID=UPI001FB8BE9D|nr:uncharacterized protein LOC125059901 [Pieris napi]